MLKFKEEFENSKYKDSEIHKTLIKLIEIASTESDSLIKKLYGDVKNFDQEVFNEKLNSPEKSFSQMYDYIIVIAKASAKDNTYGVGGGAMLNIIYDYLTDNFATAWIKDLEAKTKVAKKETKAKKVVKENIENGKEEGIIKKDETLGIECETGEPGESSKESIAKFEAKYPHGKGLKKASASELKNYARLKDLLKDGEKLKKPELRNVIEASLREPMAIPEVKKEEIQSEPKLEEKDEEPRFSF